MENIIRVLIADDHAIVRKGLGLLISTEPGMELVGEAENGVEAVELSKQLEPDVILMDLLMPKKNGIEAIREIKEIKLTSRILVLTSFAEDDKVFPAIQAGASGYILKDTKPEELLQAIREVYQGKPSLHPTIVGKLMQEYSQPHPAEAKVEILTERETEVLKLVAHGDENQEIAKKLGVSERTIGTHISNILDKLHLTNRTQAALYAIRKKIIILDP